MNVPKIHNTPQRGKTMQEIKDIFVAGLRNAHAMETQAREIMERQAERLTD
jgi:ferritin-like metal-binding protein YciE